MKRLIGYIIFSLILLVYIDVAFGYILDTCRHGAKSGPTSLMEDICERKEYSVVVFGSSRACHHYDAQMMSNTLNCEVVNAGLEGYGIITMYGILEMIVSRYIPDVVIYDVTPEYDYLVHSPGDLEKSIIPLKPFFNLPQIRALVADISASEYYKLHSNLYRYNSISLTVVKDYMSPPSGVRYRGFVPMAGSFDGVKQLLEPVSTVELHQIKGHYFHRFIELCQKHHISLCLAASPRMGACETGIFDWCEKVAEENGIPFYNFYADETISTQWELFHDPAHLNKEGAQRYTSLFLSRFLDEFCIHSTSADEKCFGDIPQVPTR